MISLKNLGKKSYFKILSHVVVIGIIGTIFIVMGNMIDVNRNNYILEKDKIVSKYEKVIREKDSINNILKNQQVELLNKVDSLDNVKIKIVQVYDKKIQSIYSATAIEHAMWMESTIERLDSMKTK